MELAPYVESLRRDLAAAAAPGGPETVRAAELLGAALEASARMGLLEALSDAAAEITTRLGNASVEVRLRGREAQFVVTEIEPTAPEVMSSATSATSPVDAEQGDITRITLRLPDALKTSIEEAAAREGVSANTYIVRALSRSGSRSSTSQSRNRLTGYAQG